MTDLHSENLEDLVREALHRRAASVQPIPRAVAASSPSMRWRGTRAVLVGFAVVVAAALSSASVLWLTADRGTQSAVRQPRIVDGRVEVPLNQLPLTTALRSDLEAPRPGVIGSGFDFHGDSGALALRPGDNTTFVVISRWRIDPPFSLPQAPTMRACVALVTEEDTRFRAHSMSCAVEYGAPQPPTGLVQGVVTLNLDGARRAFATWLDVPAGTGYVTYDSDTTHEWQVPVAGMAVFPDKIDRGPTLRAYDAGGRLLAERVIEAPEFPSEGYTGPNPAWYDLAANLRFCKNAPIDQVDFVIGGHKGKYSLFDPVTGGAATMDAREACTGYLGTRPEPQTMDLYRQLQVVDGKIQLSYYRLRDPNQPDVDTNRIPVSTDELLRINAERRSAVAPICQTNSKASWEIPACQIGG